MFPDLKNTHKNFGFSQMLFKQGFKLCVIIAWLGVYRSTRGLLTLSLFQYHKYVRNRLQVMPFQILAQCSFKVSWLLY